MGYQWIFYFAGMQIFESPFAQDFGVHKAQMLAQRVGFLPYCCRIAMDTRPMQSCVPLAQCPCKEGRPDMRRPLDSKMPIMSA